MKKFLSLFLVALLSLCAISLCGCAGEDYDNYYDVYEDGRTKSYVDVTISSEDCKTQYNLIAQSIQMDDGKILECTNNGDEDYVYFVALVSNDKVEEVIDYLTHGQFTKSLVVNKSTKVIDKEFSDANFQLSLLQERKVRLEAYANQVLTAEEKLLIEREIFEVSQSINYYTNLLNEYNRAQNYTTFSIYIYGSTSKLFDVIAGIVAVLVFVGVAVVAVVLVVKNRKKRYQQIVDAYNSSKQNASGEGTTNQQANEQNKLNE